MPAIMLTVLSACSDEKKKSSHTPEPGENTQDPALAPSQQNTAESEAQSKTAFPTLDILPEGSILKRVKFPRYDKDFTPLSLLEAEQLTVIDQNQVAAKGISVLWFGKDGQVEASTRMSHATYNQTTSILQASESVTLKGESYTATGTGLTLNFNNGRGFLLGPASTVFQIEQSDKKPATQTGP